MRFRLLSFSASQTRAHVQIVTLRAVIYPTSTTGDDLSGLVGRPKRSSHVTATIVGLPEADGLAEDSSWFGADGLTKLGRSALVGVVSPRSRRTRSMRSSS